MAEIKHTFQAGKMNKDFDERLVPQGEYRDALNIEVRTSDGSDVGSAQTLYGNIERGQFYPPIVQGGFPTTVNWLGEKSEVVGSIANEKTNKVYFFIASPPVGLSGDVTLITDHKRFKDMIVEYDTITKTVVEVLIDVFEYHSNNIGSPDTISGDFSSITVTGFTENYIKPGMKVKAFLADGTPAIVPHPTVRAVEGSTIHFDRVCTDVGETNPSYWTFTADPVLNFHRKNSGENKLITGINIIDDFLFWTDNNSEPKKINIKRSKANKESTGYPSKLYIQQPGANDMLVPVDEVDIGTDGYLKEEHITVIKRAPRTSPKLEMSRTSREDVTHGFTSNVFIGSNPGDTLVEPGSTISWVEILGASFNVGDVIIFSTISVGEAPLEIRAVVTSVSGPYSYVVDVLTVDEDITSDFILFSAELEQGKSLFELKLGRFAYRYKYQDGEYSSFSPWSELAFLPGEFDYVPKKGYNLGMVNGVKSLKITDFIVEDDLRPDDVTEVDILYKDTVSPNVYVVKTIKRGVDPEWLESSGSGSSGVLQITSGMMHRTLPSSQTLRAWDNVPRLAKAQEVTGNRVVYANYLQNYNVHQSVTLTQALEEEAFSSGLTTGSALFDEISSDLAYGRKSLKSIRKYKIGVVFGDKYGRETPVLGMGGMEHVGSAGVTRVISADVHNPKANAAKITKLSAKQSWSDSVNSYDPSDWMDYYKYYVKETTNEYYNLVMDRWYDAEDGNVWISFQSADRNKLDIETYLILKNEHGGDTLVEEEARYKIIAIENEAPTYVKTTEKILGKSAIPDSNNDLQSLDTAMVVTFDSGPWGNAFNDITFEGIGYARVRGIKDGVIKYSKWVKISRTNDVIYQVNTISPFGESANMYERFNDGDPDVDPLVTIELEIKQDIIENKPEFDGRFFVKIHKDSTLVTNVLRQTNSGVVYATVDSFEYNYIANKVENPAYNGAATQGLSTEVNWNGFGHWSVSSIDSSTAFGAGCDSSDRVKTKDYWQSYMTDSGRKNWFLDRAQAKSGHFNGDEGGSGLSDKNPNVTQGKSSLDFSRLGDNQPTGSAAAFRTKMTTPGTLFKFQGDPSEGGDGVVYEVKGNGGTWVGSRNYKKSSGCNGCSSSDTSCRRRSFRTYFSRADNAYVGLDVTVWDPRGELNHDGRGAGGSGHAGIDIVEMYFTAGETEEFLEGNAIWETEPKEDIGMDLYYEATSALPMYLDEKTNEAFAPVNSTVTCYRPGTGNISIPGAYVGTIVRDIVGIKSLDGLPSNATAAAVTNIQVGDLLRFTHGDGTVTESKVLNFWGEMDDVSDPYTPVVSYNNNLTLTSSTTANISGDEITALTSGTWQITDPNWGTLYLSSGTSIISYSHPVITFSPAIYQINSGPFEVNISSPATGYYQLDDQLYNYKTILPWFNCYTFGNGLESDRIRDDFNAPTIDNGVKVSTSLDTYGEERRANGLIYSGIYNSTSGVNKLNEFNMAEAITKDLNPSYGSIQALKSRDTNLVTFCEDKVLQILANKDALYNADGSSNVTASNAVLGDAKSFAGDYGISSNPESLAVDGYRMYFTDKQRNKVLRLSQDGLTPISDVGMTSYFRDNLQVTSQLLGSFDEIKGEYNLSLKHASPQPIYVGNGEVSWTTSPYTDKTLSFSEKTKGWSSFKSFIPQTGLSINDEYLTATEGRIWSHHIEPSLSYATVDNPTVALPHANNFYGVQYDSSIDVLFNEDPGSVKGFTTVNYEGSQAKINKFTTDTVEDAAGNTITANDNNYYNLNGKNGWYVNSFTTDQQDGKVKEFIEKEGKWFNNILGVATTLSNLDTSEFSVQGIGQISGVEATTLVVNDDGTTSTEAYVPSFTLTIQEDGE